VQEKQRQVISKIISGPQLLTFVDPRRFPNAIPTDDDDYDDDDDHDDDQKMMIMMMMTMMMMVMMVMMFDDCNFC